MKVLYRITQHEDGQRFDVQMRDETGRWTCVNFGLLTFKRASEIADGYRREEAKHTV